ncbi:hypothetical protein HMPREF9148_01534 [Prevotella sp. F0091]|nr:hypothetical protein HMPREF9148_01534 [Prevotella sp. F0091]
MKKNIYFHEKNLDTANDRYADCMDIKQKNAFAELLQRRFLFYKICLST